MRRQSRWWVLPAVATLFILLLTAWWLWNRERPPHLERQIVILDQEGREQVIGLEQFLVGVVAAEMPASFQEEALKAQAIASRTYVAAHMSPFGSGRHGKAVVCCDSSCCQAYLDDASLKKRWGDNYAVYRRKIEAAVKDTAGQILMWQGQPAEALYHSTCGGTTEDAAAVWGKSVPYLIPVNCGYCTKSSRYTGWVSYSLAEAAKLLQTDAASLQSMQVISHTPGNRVGLVQLGSQVKKGTELRQLLSLNSAAFTWLIMDDRIIFCSVGYGHGVGLCQYGADGMGRDGYTYQEILARYFPGTALIKLTER